MFLVGDKLVTQGEKRETSTKTCNETMLPDKLSFVSRISPALATPIWFTGMSLKLKEINISAERKTSWLLTGISKCSCDICRDVTENIQRYPVTTALLLN